MREVKAAAVVVGATELIGPPSNPAKTGAVRNRSCNWRQPRPSRVSSTTWAAPPRGAGSHAGRCPRPAGLSYHLGLAMVLKAEGRIPEAKEEIIAELVANPANAQARELLKSLSGESPAKP